MTSTKPPGRPGNDHDERPDLLDSLERGVISCLPLAVIIAAGAAFGLIWAEVT